MLLTLTLLNIHFAEGFLIHCPVEPLSNIKNLLSQLLRTHDILDIYFSFAFENPSHYDTYIQTALEFDRSFNGLRASHFNLNEIPLSSIVKHVIFADSLVDLRYFYSFTI